MADILVPFVSIIIPCRNEAGYIRQVLENIVSQDYPEDRIEVIIADGMSDDGTRGILDEFCAQYSFIRYIDNPAKVVPHGLNAAIRVSAGEVIIRMDAHAVYPLNYITVLVDGLNRYNADNTGGSWITEPGNSSRMAKAIAQATSHLFGIGNARYRLGASRPVEVDTVPFGCYRRSVFDKIGFFDEDLIRNQDDEFNARLRNSGRKIMLIPSVQIRYFARNTLRKMIRMFYQYGLFKPLVNRKTGKPATWRQFFPPLLLAGCISGAILACFSTLALIIVLALGIMYLISILFFSVVIALRSGMALFFPLILVFPSIHFSYGAGYWVGIFRFLIFRTKPGKLSKVLEVNR